MIVHINAYNQIEARTESKQFEIQFDVDPCTGIVLAVNELYPDAKFRHYIDGKASFLDQKYTIEATCEVKPTRGRTLENLKQMFRSNVSDSLAKNPKGG